MNHSYETATAEDQGDGLVLLTLNRPQVANAMNTQMGRDLLAFFDAVNADPLRLSLHRRDRGGRQGVLRRRRPQGTPGHVRRAPGRRSTCCSSA